jgi:hypothetical protein
MNRPEPETCGAAFVTGGHDPSSTECDLAPERTGLPHRGRDPLGGDGYVQWSGGGSCAGDPLPYHGVRWVH